MVTAAGFGGQLDQAVLALRVAMAEEPSEVRRVILASWLVELAG